MPEIVSFLNHGAALITPVLVEKVLRNLPLWKVEFAQLDAPQFPHLPGQLDFLADVVEDFAEGADKEIPLYAVAQAVFALIYVHNKVGIIPGSIPQLAKTDNSSVVRAALIQSEKPFSDYAKRHGLEWSTITIRP
jgi:hypothetical protein